jgi:quercetin dioxygenase-like cupin family protein
LDFNIFKQFSDVQGESHLERLSQDEFKRLSEWHNAKSFRFHVHSPETFLDWHAGESDYIIVVLSGKLEICVSDGTKIICEPGVLRLTSDRGKGHTGRAIGDSPCAILMVDIGK